MEGYVVYIVVAGSALLFVFAERLFPRYRFNGIRDGFFTDLFYLLFNLVIFWIIADPVIVYIQKHFYAYADKLEVASVFYKGILQGFPFWQKLLLFILVYDFLQYGIHYLLHRLDFLWHFHRVHHSIRDIDWVGNWRFHWMELVVYGFLMFIPLSAIFGVGTEEFPVIYIFTVCFSNLMGHFNHSNTKFKIGPLKYIFNSPAMHIWHHNYHKPYNKNFAVIFSAWDWIFGTAHMPDENPKKLGYYGMKKLPKSLFWQLVIPVKKDWFVRAGKAES